MYRLLAPLAAVSGLLLAIGVGGAWYVQRLHRRAASVLAVEVLSIRAAEELEISVRDIRSRVADSLLTGEERQLDSLPALRERVNHWLSEVERWAQTDDERELVEKIKHGRAHLYEELDRLPEEVRRGTSTRTARELVLDVLPNEILVHAQNYLDLNERDLARSNEEIQRMADRIVFGLLLLGICGSVAGLVAGYGIARSFSRGLIQLTVSIRNVAGKLNESAWPITLAARPRLEDLEAVMRQVTERVEAIVAQWQLGQKQALEAEKMAAVGQLAAGLAHELRNPLMCMKILIQTAVEQGDAGGLWGRDLKVLEEEIGRLEGLVRSFLDFARPPEPSKTAVVLPSLIRQTVDLADLQARRRGVHIQTLLPEQPTVVLADFNQLRQLLLNLLFNSLDAVRDGGRIAIALLPPRGNTAGGSSFVRISVADDGPGLPAEIGERIFEPFVSSKVTGLGLGLAICRRICEAHGGCIEARNRPEGGAEFTVDLPLADADRDTRRGALPKSDRLESTCPPS